MLIVRWAPVTETDRIPPLGEELQKHLNGYRNLEVRHASSSAWGLLYDVLKENGLETGCVSFEKKGKPYFRQGGVFFSLSHSRGVCAAAVSDRPVGVDVEMLRESFRAGLVAKTLNEDEKNAFDGDFTRIWCRKESVAKLTGEGIVGYPREIDTLSASWLFTEEKLEYRGNAYWLVAAVENA